MKIGVRANVSLPDNLPERVVNRYLPEIGNEFKEKFVSLLKGLGFEEGKDFTITDTKDPTLKIVETEDDTVGLIIEQNASYYQVTGKGD